MEMPFCLGLKQLNDRETVHKNWMNLFVIITL